jgi:hypothetical protein
LIATYTVQDGAGLTASSNVVLTVQEPLNRPPDARDDGTDVFNGGTVTTSVLFNDTDPDGDPLTVELTGGPDPSIGTASLSGDQSVTFTAVPGAAGTASIDYQVSDGEFTDGAVLRITVRPCSESTPVAADTFLQTGYQQPIAIDLNNYASNGTIVDVVTPPGLTDGVYTPPAGENGNALITYSVVNSCRQRATGRVTIDVNQDPVVTAKTISVGRGVVVELPVSDLATDAEPLTVVSNEGAPSWVAAESARLVIAPTSATATGVYTWTTVVQDPGGLAGSVPVTVTVTNRPPVATNDSIDVSTGAPGVFGIIDNDTDPDGAHNSLRIRSVPATITFSNGEVGTVVVSAAGRKVTVDPQDGKGSATFEYTVEDIDGAVSAPATVSVTGPRLNTPPFALDQSVAVEAGEVKQVVLEAGDADGDRVAVVNLNDPSAVVIDRDGLTVTIKVAPPGIYTFTYQVEDDLDSSRVATVTVTASPPATTTTSTTTSTTTTTLAPVTT